MKHLIDLLQLNEWDWIAFLVAFFSMCVAVRSYLIARKTLKSQRNTEKNTKPLMNESVQEFLMKENFLHIFDAFINLNSLMISLRNINFSKYPYQGLLEDLRINPGFIHLEIFYEDIDVYHAIKGFNDAIVHYNSYIESFFQSIREKELTSEKYDELLRDMIEDVNDMAQYWMIVMNQRYQYDNHKFSTLMDHIVSLFNVKETQEKVVSSNYFTCFFEDKGKQDDLIRIMNNIIVSNSSEFTKLLIDYERN